MFKRSVGVLESFLVEASGHPLEHFSATSLKASMNTNSKKTKWWGTSNSKRRGGGGKTAGTALSLCLAGGGLLLWSCVAGLAGRPTWSGPLLLSWPKQVQMLQSTWNRDPRFA